MGLHTWNRFFLFKQNFFSFYSVFLCLLISACASNQTVATQDVTQIPTPTLSQRIETPSLIPLPSATSTTQPVLTGTPEGEMGDIADYYGGLVITLDHVGQTITMKPGQGFVLRLGGEFQWDVVIDPGNLLTINRKITPEQGEQGVYVARQKGAARLSAIGRPNCLQNDPPCSRPSVLFKLNLDIQ
jgi:hypothetical protein